MDRLKNYAYNIESQWGEDGIIEQIFKRIGDGNKVCVEFGAYDGPHLSNTWNLWFNKGWNALLIEGNTSRALRLEDYTRNHKNIKILHRYVSITGENSIDSIIDKEWPNHKNIDLMSIDIDGDEYYILENIEKYKPRVMIIEYNPTIPPGIEIIQEKGEYFGSSASSIIKLAKTKGYSLVEMIGTNCIFIKNDEYNKIYDREYSIEELFPREFLTYVISSYNGYSFLTRKLGYSSAKKIIIQPRIKSDSELVPVGNILRTYKPNVFEIIRRYLRIIYYKVIRIINRDKAASHDYKTRIIKSFAKKYNIDTLVETGTYHGDMINKIKHDFSKIYSIELNNDLFNNAKEKFKHYSHINIIQGDSGKKLKDILKNINTPCLFWLDGHYSGGITSRGDKDTPIVNELETIFLIQQKHIILIDDARCFNGTNDYPTIKTIREIANKHGYSFKNSNDIMRIY